MIDPRGIVQNRQLAKSPDAELLAAAKCVDNALGIFFARVPMLVHVKCHEEIKAGKEITCNHCQYLLDTVGAAGEALGYDQIL